MLINYAVFVLRRSSPEAAHTVQKTQRNVQSNEMNPSQSKRSYALGLSMGLTNPYQIAWWLSVGLASISSFGPFVAVGFFVGIIVENTIYATVLKFGFSRLKEFEWWVLIATSFVLLAFGAWLFIKAIVIFFT